MVTGLSQIILYVTDMNDSVAFYHGLLGLPLRQEALADYAATMWVELDGGGCTLALHGGGKGVSGDAAMPVFAVTNVEETRLHLTAHDTACGEIIDAAPGIRVFAARDPDGNPLSFKQTTPAG